MVDDYFMAPADDLLRNYIRSGRDLGDGLTDERFIRLSITRKRPLDDFLDSVGREEAVVGLVTTMTGATSFRDQNDQRTHYRDIEVTEQIKQDMQAKIAALISNWKNGGVSKMKIYTWFILMFSACAVCLGNTLELPSKVGRDLRLLVIEGVQLKALVDGNEAVLNFTGLSRVKTERERLVAVKVPQGTAISELPMVFKRLHPELSYMLNESSTVILFSRNQVFRMDLLVPSDDFRNLKVAAGDVVIVGNFGDYF